MLKARSSTDYVLGEGRRCDVVSDAVTDKTRLSQLVVRLKLNAKRLNSLRKTEILFRQLGEPGSDVDELLDKFIDDCNRLRQNDQTESVNINAIQSVHYASVKPEFIVPKLIVDHNITVLSGRPSQGKSIIALWLSNLIATGAQFFHYGKCEQHPVPYLTREMEANYVAEIVRQFNLEGELDGALKIWGNWLPAPAPMPATNHVVAWIKSQKVSPFIVVDSVIAFYDGKTENDGVEMRRFYNNQGRTLLRAGACGVLFIAHPSADDDSKLRCSSDQIAAIDSAFFVTNSGDRSLERVTLKSFRPRYTEQLQELVLNYRDGDFTVDASPAVGYKTVTEQLRQLLADNPGVKKDDFEKTAMAKGLTRKRARAFIEDGVKAGSIHAEPSSIL